jgi:CHAT domain-containing protein
MVIGGSLAQNHYALEIFEDPLKDKKVPVADLVKTKEKAIEFGQSWNKEKIEQAYSILVRLSVAFEKQNNRIESSNCLREASNLKIILGDSKGAVQLLKKSLKLEQKEGNFAGESETTAFLAYVHSILGNSAESGKNLNRTLSLLDNIQKTNTLAKIYFYLGEVYYSREDIPNFFKFYTQSLKQFRQSGDQPGEAKTLLALAYANLGKDDITQGLSLAQEALQKWQIIGDMRGQALSLVALGLSQFRIGQSRAALDSFSEAEKLFPMDVDKSERAVLVYNMGRVYEHFGDCERTINYYKNSLELFTEENNLSLSVGNLWSLGAVSYLCGSKNESLQYLQQSLRFAESLGKKHDMIAIHVELAEIYLDEGLFDKSKVYYQSALKILKDNKYKWSKARVLRGLGDLYERTNKIDLARENYLSALEISHSIRDNFAEAETLHKLAILHAHENKQEEALKQIKQSLDLTEMLYTDVLNSKLRRTYFSNVYDRYELYINLLMKMHEHFPLQGFHLQAFQAAEKSRARSMFENLRLAEVNFIKDADAGTISRERGIRVLLNAKADKLINLLSGGAEKGETNKLENEINELEHELEEIKAKLKQSSPIYSAIKNPSPFEVAELQGKFLDENTLLVEFSFGREQSYLWVVDKNEVSSYVLPPRDQIETRIENLRELLASREMKKDEAIEDYQKRIVDSENKYWLEAQILSHNLFGQIADKITGKRLVVIPDGKLHYFPVSALPLPGSNQNEPILLTSETIYEPSAQTLLLLAQSNNQPSQPAKNLLVFSDPVFSSNDSRLSNNNKLIENTNNDLAPTGKFRFVESLDSLPRLIASKDESDSIVSIVGGKSDVFAGFVANREQFLKTKVSDYRIIHFATHAVIDEAHPELSGIVLSRFDRTGQKMNEFVRMQDIYGLNLFADLVVLSACSTSIGKEVKGEGLLSLNNAFLQSGAKSVISSFWKVDDYATLELMKNFYKALANEKTTPSEALRDAQIKMWQNPRYQSPFYWAAFNIQGNFRQPPTLLSSSKSYSVCLLILLLPIFMLVIYLQYRFSRTKS